VFIGLAATAGAQLSAETIGRKKASGPPGGAVWAAKVGYGLCVSAAVTLGLATAVALNGAAYWTSPVTPFLTWTLLSVGPLAGLIALVGLLMPRTWQKVDWPARLRFPLDALCLGVVGVLLVHVSASGIPSGLSDLWFALDRFGAAAVGWSIALLVTTRRRLRAVLALVLGIVGASVIALQTYTAIGAVLIVMISWWWLTRAGRAVLAALPSLGQATLIQPPSVGDDAGQASPG
jgi:hypothetical protein